MKSRTSSFNRAALRKDITRFAPAWGLYSVFLLLSLVMLLDGYSRVSLYRHCDNLAESIQLMAVVNLGYALVCAQLLFGDLYNSRMCNALHAMPLRRESWFLTHVAAGLLFSLVPNLVFTAVNCVMLGSLWTVGLYWLLGVSLQYLFFFGLAVFSALCVGNRFAMALVYGILNFLSLLAYWLLSVLYEPLLYGVRFVEEPFLLLCPVWQMVNAQYLAVDNLDEAICGSVVVNLGEGWGYLAVCGGIGLVLLVLAMLLYRRRKLECAGDFMAEPKMAPVFLVLYTLAVGTVFQTMGVLFGFSEHNYLFLAVGMVVGFFTGQMLLKRTVRVFRPKELAGLAAFAAAMALSLGLTALDPMGVVTRIPEAEDIEYAVISSTQADCRLESPEDLENLRLVHQAALEHRSSQYLDGYYMDSYEISFTLIYTGKDGTVLRRYYALPVDSEAGNILRGFLSRPEVVLGEDYRDPEQFLGQIQDICVDGGEVWLDREDFPGLLEAVLQDCREGTMVQHWAYHNEDYSVCWVEFCNSTRGERNWYWDIRVYSNCKNTLAWLESHGYAPEE